MRIYNIDNMIICADDTGDIHMSVPTGQLMAYRENDLIRFIIIPNNSQLNIRNQYGWRADQIFDNNGNLYGSTLNEVQEALSFVLNTRVTTPPVVIPPLTVDNTPFLLKVQQTGFVNEKRAMIVHVMGRRQAFVTGRNDVKEFSTAVGEILLLDGTQPLTVVSSSASDAAAGTGVRTVQICYLDTNDDVRTVDVNLNGLTPVNIPNATAIQYMEAINVGSNGVAVGNITIQSGANVYEQISIGGNKSLSARCKIPRGYTAYLVDWDVASGNQDMDVRLSATVTTKDRTLIGNFLFQDSVYTGADQSSAHFDMNWLRFPALSHIKVTCIPASTTGSPYCDVSYTLLLIED